eukprot:m.97653 g.97653  ORF g.97653 m.97653 type:complete len:252 (+) comp26997_c0_seq4:114-869(+)
MGVYSCWERFWANTIVFWGFTFGGFLFRLIDYGLDIAYTTQTILGSEFEQAYGKDRAKTVQSIAIALLILNGILLVVINFFMIRAKLRIWRLGLLEDPAYLYRISWIEFLELLAGFIFEDAPETVLTVIVESATNNFGLLAQLQLASAVVFLAYFIAKTIRNFILFRDRDREAEQATHSQTKHLAKKALRQPTRKAIVAVVKEPRRAKKAKKEYADKNQRVKDGLDMGFGNRIVNVPRKLASEPPVTQTTI